MPGVKEWYKHALRRCIFVFKSAQNESTTFVVPHKSALNFFLLEKVTSCHLCSDFTVYWILGPFLNISMIRALGHFIIRLWLVLNGHCLLLEIMASLIWSRDIICLHILLHRKKFLCSKICKQIMSLDQMRDANVSN